VVIAVTARKDGVPAAVQAGIVNVAGIGSLLGLPQFRGQVDRSHAMNLRLFINDQPDQDQAPVYGAAEC
jgi:hypothetical protein